MSAPLSLEARFMARTIDVGGGHLEWVGTWFRWGGVHHRPGRIAFRIRTGREPIGYVRAECGHRGCVEPAHVEDQPGRDALRAQLRTVQGLRPRPAICAHGHDQAIDGRLEPDGRAYCIGCARGQRGAA